MGISGFEGWVFCIGYMGYLNLLMVLGALGIIEAAFLLLGAELGAFGVVVAARTIASTFVFELVAVC